jgi:hypothetical protein
MENKAHQPGTVAGCPSCREVVYEPGWYQMLRRLAEPDRPRSLHLACGDPHPWTRAPDPSPEGWTAGARPLVTSGLGF